MSKSTDADQPNRYLPCNCGPGVLNLCHTPGPVDYECPTCGSVFTAEEVRDDDAQ